MNIPTLLPYVMSENQGIHLNLTEEKDSKSSKGNISGIFKIMDEPDGLTRLYEASLMTDAGSHIRRLFLLVQKNRYSAETNNLPSFNNRDIELCWQRAFIFYAKESREMPVHLFAGQTGMGDILLPFHSLFYCRKKNIYFHPPCPQCGGPLTQCHDDELLTSAGLPAYGVSLERFLFCPSCHEIDHTSPFYIENRDGRYDPAVVKDQNDMIKSFGNIQDSQHTEGTFPCASCDTYQQCYGKEYLAAINIIPFSFYPFYMLAFDAGSLNAVDFISLLSEASLEDLSSQIVSNGPKDRLLCVERLKNQPYTPAYFFREGDDRRFLEIMYLKLTFLQEVFAHFFSHLDNPHYPNPEMSLDRLWVRLNNRVGLLPFFWNFGVLPFCGVAGHCGKNLKDKQALPFNRLYHMGLAWLRVLISNPKNDINTISNAIMQSLEIENVEDETTWNIFLFDAYPSIFSPEQISLHGENFNIDEKGMMLFNKALSLGLTLIRSGLGHNPKWSDVAFDLDLKTLRETIAENLFPHIHSPAVSQEDMDGKIKEILVKAKNKILARQTAGHISNRTINQEVATNTVILTPQEPLSAETPEQTIISKHLAHDAISDVDEDDDLAKTVIYRPDGETKTPGKPETGETMISHTDDDDISRETVMLSAGESEEPEKTSESVSSAVTPTDDDDDLSRTVMLREPSSNISTPTPSQDDDLGKTRIIRKSEPEKSIKKNLWGDSIDDSDDDDFLEKTLHIRKGKKSGPEND